MFEFERLKKKYNKLIKDTLNKNKQIIIDSLIEYYGEEYRNIIVERYDRITFVYYINWELVKKVVDEFLSKSSKPNEYVSFNNFRKYYNKEESYFKKITQNGLPNNFVGSTNNDIFHNYYLKESVIGQFNYSGASCLGYEFENCCNQIICFPILVIDELTIIHEINHAITEDILIKEVDEKKYSGTLVFKSGLSIDENERMFNELINEKTSQEIFRIFKEKGGDFTLFCTDIPFVYPHRNNLYLIDELYDKLKNYIKIAEISNNKNYLIERIGKDNYKKYVELVNKYYSSYPDEINKFKESALNEIKELLKLMEENVGKSIELSDEDLDLCFEQLEKQGHTIKFINNNNYGISEDNIYNDNNRKIR